ncbi:MAG: NADH-quinone oxidoreductase subunit M [Planctomycetes bacterium]|nr:NADH-quinone oxidoreductase subunit M [Planctomycetota bacterium]
MTENFIVAHALFTIPFISILVVLMCTQETAKRFAVALSAVCFAACIYSTNFVGQTIVLPLAVIDSEIIFQLDWISYFLILLNSLLTMISIYASVNIIKMQRFFYSAFFFSYLACNGVFLSRDLVSFYIFWELTIIPMFFIIGIWGGERRIYATVKFIIYTLVGSIAMLGCLIYILQHSPDSSFESAASTIKHLSVSIQQLLFLGFFLAFSIKVPVFPFHTWLPDAHVEAPTAGSVILAGILLKLGTYAYIRILIPLFSDVARQFSTVVVALGIIGIIYGALMSYIQSDIKKIIAYSSVSHMGFVIIGAFSFNNDGLNGAYLQMINHGISTGALFLLVGILYYRSHTRDIDDFGGLATAMKTFAFFFMLTTLSSIGLPGLNGFVGEFLSIAGSYKCYGIIALTALIGVVLSACYMLRLWLSVFWGEQKKSYPDMTTSEAAYITILSALMVILGIYPSLILSKITWNL